MLYQLSQFAARKMLQINLLQEKMLQKDFWFTGIFNNGESNNLWVLTMYRILFSIANLQVPTYMLVKEAIRSQEMHLREGRQDNIFWLYDQWPKWCRLETCVVQHAFGEIQPYKHKGMGKYATVLKWRLGETIQAPLHIFWTLALDEEICRHTFTYSKP